MMFLSSAAVGWKTVASMASNLGACAAHDKRVMVEDM
jgi:hypothetical protein